MFENGGTIFGLACVAILMVVVVSLQFDLAPNDPKWRRRWAVFAYSVTAIFLLWLVVLIVFIKPQGN